MKFQESNALAIHPGVAITVMLLLLILVIVSAVLIRGGRKTLKPLVHLLAVLLLLPSFLFACACLVLQKAVSHGTFFGFLDAIFSFLLAMLPWGIAVLVVCFATLVAAGFRLRWRRVGAGVVIALAVASAVVMHVIAGLPDDPGQWWLFAPGLLSVLISGWLCAAPQSGEGKFVLVSPAGLRILTMGGMLAVSSLHAQTPSPAPTPTFEQRLREVRSVLRVDKDGFGGDGAPVLAKAVADARYVLIGEDHFTREIPLFTSAVCDLMASEGLFALATEASPTAAAFVGATLDKPDRAARLAVLLKKYPDCVAFLDSAQENELAAHAARTVRGSGFQLWGLDQELLGSAGWLLDEILAQHPGPAAAAALARLQVEERKDADEAKGSGDPSKLFLFAVADAELAETGALLQREGNQAANDLFHGLVASHEIYVKNVQGAPDANLQRARLLKEQFRQRLEAAAKSGQHGRVLVKLGDWHLYKGFNPLRERDLGNYIAEIADEQGSASLHICILGAKGRHALYGGYARPLRIEPFVMADDPDYRWIKPAVDNQTSDGWTLYDLRRLRSGKIVPPDPAMSRLIEGYDLLVIIPEVTPADQIR